VQGLYFAVPMIGGYYIMQSVVEGGPFHKGAAEITAANREQLLEHHRRPPNTPRSWGGRGVSD
jgi:hypothetical protein